MPPEQPSHASQAIACGGDPPEVALAELLRGRRVVALTGAGMSTDSGIPDYRGASGRLRHRTPVQHRDFVRDPAVRQRYWARSYVGWPTLRGARPNGAHTALAALEAAGLVAGTITQNVDGLHQAAGAARLIELHGALARVRCLACFASETRDDLQARLEAANPGFAGAHAAAAPDGDADLASDLVGGFQVAHCAACGGLLKPDVVFFGDNVPRERVAEAFHLADSADVLLVLGSSLHVFSGYRFVRRAAERGASVAIVNEGQTRGDDLATVRVDGRLGAVLSRLARGLGCAAALSLALACSEPAPSAPTASAPPALTTGPPATPPTSQPTTERSSMMDAKDPKIADTEARGRAFVSLLHERKFGAAVAEFDATMRAALPEAKLGETWDGLLAGVGPFEKIEGARVEPVGAYRTALVTCVFAKARLDAKIAYDKEDKVAGLFFAPAPESYADPSYVDRSKFEERDVVVGSGEWALPATLAMPRGAGPFPAVVLVHGSGPNDRDESVGANRPFKDLAGGLASRGIAVLRYEKRTKVHGAKLARALDLTVHQETVEDALLAVDLLRATTGVAADKIVVAGHSLGGAMAPRIGYRSEHVRALVILAGSTRPLPDMMIEQMTYIAGLDGRQAPEEMVEIQAVKKARARIQELEKGAKPSEGEVLLGAGPVYWTDLAKYDALATAKLFERPIFVGQGGRDYQVTTVDFDAWKRALAGRKDVVTRLYPALNHLFGAGEGKSSPEEYQRRTPVDAGLIEDVAAFVASL